MKGITESDTEVSIAFRISLSCRNQNVEAAVGATSGFVDRGHVSVPSM
jgi:hypothetical protein